MPTVLWRVASLLVKPVKEFEKGSFCAGQPRSITLAFNEGVQRAPSGQRNLEHFSLPPVPSPPSLAKGRNVAAEERYLE